MRDAKLTAGPKRYYEDLDLAISELRERFPNAQREGSIGAWSWLLGEKVLAEAWLHATLPGWWVRVGRDADSLYARYADLVKRYYQDDVSGLTDEEEDELLPMLLPSKQGSKQN